MGSLMISGVEMVTFNRYSSEVLSDSSYIYSQTFSLVHGVGWYSEHGFIGRLDTIQYCCSLTTPIDLRCTSGRSSMPRATIPDGRMDPNTLTNLKDPAPTVIIVPRSI